jgi:hypothetical protein
MGGITVLDLWSGLFAALIGGVIGLVGSVVGAVIAGRLMIAQQDRGYRRRVDEAARALLIELENNLAPLSDLMNAAAREIEPRYPPVVSDIVWRANLPILTSLGYETLRTVTQAYRKIDLVMAECVRRERMDWCAAGRNKPLVDAHDAVREAIKAVLQAAIAPKKAWLG